MLCPPLPRDTPSQLQWRSQNLSPRAWKMNDQQQYVQRMCWGWSCWGCRGGFVYWWPVAIQWCKKSKQLWVDGGKYRINIAALSSVSFGKQTLKCFLGFRKKKLNPSFWPRFFQYFLYSKSLRDWFRVHVFVPNNAFYKCLEIKIFTERSSPQVLRQEQTRPYQD